MPDPFPELQDLKRGDEQAWNQAFHSLWRFAYHAAGHRRAALSPDEAEDVAIDALAKLVPHIGTVSSMEELKALLVTIAQRQAISVARYKSAAKRPQVALSLDALPQSESEPLLNRADVDHPLSEAESAELVGLLREALRDMDETTRSLLSAQHADGLTIRELSERFGLPPGTVSVKLARGLQKVRLRLKQWPRLLKQLQDFRR